MVSRGKMKELRDELMDLRAERAAEEWHPPMSLAAELARQERIQRRFKREQELCMLLGQAKGGR